MHFKLSKKIQIKFGMSEENLVQVVQCNGLEMHYLKHIKRTKI